MDRFRSLTTLVAAAALTGLLAIWTAGCYSGTEEPKAPEAAPTTEPGSATAGTESAGEAEGSARKIDPSRFPKDLPEGVEAAIPSNFPSDLPIYPGSEPAQGRGVRHEDIEMSALQLVTLDSPEQAFEFYRDNLESTGWTIENSQDLGENAAISAAKGDRKVSILFSPASDGGADIFVITEG
jgi:hypothetical protein